MEMKKKKLSGLVRSRAGAIEKYYKKLIHEEHGYLKFTAYNSLTGKGVAKMLKVPLQEIFLPIDFSGFASHDNQVIDSPGLLEDSNSKVILAGPGYGKTTFLKFLLLNSLKKKIIPVYWECKNLYPLVEKTGNFRDVMLEYFKGLLKDKFNIKEIKAFTREQQFLFLLDGFDEVGEPGRLPLIQSIIEDNIKNYPGDYFVIASRIAGYPGEYVDFFTGNGFHHYEIKPLSEHLIFQYINNFITVQFPGDTLKSTEKIKFLSKYIETQPGIKTLAGHPLLLSLIVLIYTFEGSLPDTKVNLYERCIELLVYVWKKTDNDIKIFNELSLDNNTLYVLLSDVAYEYFVRFTRGKAEKFGVMPRGELQEILKQSYKNLTRRKLRKKEIGNVMEKLFNYFKNNTGVIVEIAPGQFGFSHLTLLEYLAARHIIREKVDFNSNLDYIVQLLENPGFRAVEEVVIFQVELLGKSTSRNRFVDTLAKRLLSVFKENKNQAILVLLAKLLKDNQEFSIHDAKEILKLITISVARIPENRELYNLLNDIFLFSRESRDYFVELLGKSTREREIWENFSQRTAHRIGNKVFSIRSDLNIVEKEARKLRQKNIDSDKIEQKLNQMAEQIQSLNMILAEYRDFSSEIDIAYREYDIDSLLRELVHKLNEVYNGVMMRYNSHGKTLSAFTDKDRIKQILEELIENSIKHAQMEALAINFSLEYTGNRFVIHFKDNGKGVPVNIKTKIFEPFYTTHSKSTGIGLANIKKIVESLNGEIKETGHQGKGVHFELSFIIAWRR